MRNKTVFIGVAFLVVGFIIGYIVGFNSGKKYTRESSLKEFSSEFQNPPSAKNIDPKVEEIARELNCVCGCGLELLPCECDTPNGAKEITGFIQDLVDKGLSKSQVIERAVDKYTPQVLINSNR